MDYISYCGLKCNECPVFLATINNDNILRKKLAKQYSTKKCIFTEEDMNCLGCHSNMAKKSKMCGNCEIRNCKSNKDISNCGECEKYPCKLIKKYVPDGNENSEFLNKINNRKGIIFDLDGTLWDASKQVIPAWNIALSRHKELNKQITDEDMRGFMGKQLQDIAKIMLPELPLEKSLKILNECCSEEQVYLRENGADLYPDLENTLKKLSKRYFLYIVSNCQDGYVQAFLDHHELWSFFSDIEMSGRTGKCKGENIKIIIARNKLKKAVYVGDTDGDLEGASYADIPFIHAAYGFGNLEDIKYSIQNIKDIDTIIDNII